MGKKENDEVPNPLNRRLESDLSQQSRLPIREQNTRKLRVSFFRAQHEESTMRDGDAKHRPDDWHRRHHSRRRRIYLLHGQQENTGRHRPKRILSDSRKSKIQVRSETNLRSG